MSNDLSNRHLNRVRMVPLTTSVARTHPGEAVIRINGVPHKALANQITTATRDRLQGLIGTLNADDLANVEWAIRLQLGL